jgi:hypothetical protein
MVADDGLVGDRAAPEQSHDELAGMAAALAELTPNQRRAILLREWQGLSYREIAAELELTEAAVETLLFRARRSLARKLDRSRGSAWAWLDLGSALAAVKSLLGGTAAQVAAATLVVAAGVTASAPSPAGHAATSVPVVVRAVVPAAAHAEIVQRPDQHSATSSPGQARRKPAVVAARRARPTRPVGGRPARTAPQTEPVADPAPGAGSVPTQEPKAPSAPAPQLPSAPPPPAVRVPPPPSLPRLPALPAVPAVPPLPPVSLPQLPSVPLPVLPPLPKLP